MRWKEPAGDFMANSHDVIPAFPVDGEGGPRERWMRWKGESQGYSQSGSGHVFLPPLKERARGERRQAARPDRPGTVIEAAS